MSDTTSNDKTKRVPARKPLSQKHATDNMRQSFSGRRAKAVLVEKKRSRVAPCKRLELPGSTERDDAPKAAPKATEAAVQASPARAETAAPAPQVHVRPRTGGVVLRTLTDEERDAR